MTDSIQRFFHRAVAAGASVPVSPVNQERKTLANVALVFDNRHREFGSNLGGRVVLRVSFGGHQHYQRLCTSMSYVTAYLCRAAHTGPVPRAGSLRRVVDATGQSAQLESMIPSLLLAVP